jgi:hypothetical protein
LVLVILDLFCLVEHDYVEESKEYLS